MPSKSALPSLLLAGTIGGLLGALGSSLLQPAAQTHPREAARATNLEPDLGGLRQDLRDLIQAMKARPMTLPASAAPATRTLVTSDNRDILAALSSLEQAIRDMASPRGLTPNSTIEATPLHLGTPGIRDHSACLSTSREVLKDQDLARPKYFGMSVSQIYERFGPPEYAQPTGETLQWNYSTEEEEYDLTFVFYGGLVIDIWA